MPDRASQNITINAKPVKVLEAILEIDDYPKWIPDIVNVEVFERDSNGRALTAKTTMKSFGKTISHTYEYSYEDYPEIIGWMLVEGDMVSSLDGFYKLEALSDEQARVTYELYVDLDVSIPGFLKSKATEKIVSSALENLKRYCEN